MIKRDKSKKLVKLDEDLTFDEAMDRIAKAKKKDVDGAMKDAKEDRKLAQEEGGENTDTRHF